jgi:hypothetical protein
MKSVLERAARRQEERAALGEALAVAAGVVRAPVPGVSM